MAGERDNAVLAFLLGSMQSLDAAGETDAVAMAESESESEAVEGEDDLPALDPVSDSDEEPETDVSATADANSSSDWDAATSGESEDESCQEQQVAASESAPQAKATEVEEDLAVKQKICKEDQGLKRSAEVTDTENEDDCAAQMSADSGGGVQHGDKFLPMKQKKVWEQSPRAVTKPAKTVEARQEPTGNRPSMAIIQVTSSKDLSAETKLKRAGSESTMEELLFVGCVATILVAYLVACVYSFFHPLVLPLPDYDELYSAFDISNVSVHIVNPTQNSQITPQGVVFEWQLVNFPAEALDLYGAEVFRYQVSLDDKVITSEVEFLALKDEERGTEALNRTVGFPIPLRKFTRNDDDESGDLFKLHLEVTIPIPGLIEELKTYEQEIHVQKLVAPSEVGVHLTLTSPLDGATYEQNRSIVLEYTAVNVHNMEVLIDDIIYLKKTHVNDGNLLLRGLGIGSHKFEVRAIDERDAAAASSTVHVDIIERVHSQGSMRELAACN